jgi:hypothetical protein
VYASNGVPDISADAMITKCTGVSTDFTSISVGEFLWMKGHCGIYIGDGLVIESTPKWNNGVQITAIGKRAWTKHGKLPYVRYDAEEERTVTIEMQILKKGANGKQVETLQRLLISLGYDLGNYGADGDFGSRTDAAVRAYQKKNDLIVDGVVGRDTWRKLLCN